MMSSDISHTPSENWRRRLADSPVEYPVVRRKSRGVKVGGVIIGAGFPISVQSMTNTDTRDIAATVAQIKRLEEAGCEIARVAVLNSAAATCLGEIKKQISIPLVADIHFSHTLALKAIEQGVDKVRLNPGNIGADWKVAEVVEAAKGAGIPIRIGVNSGSIPDALLAEFGHNDPRAFVAAALGELEILEKHDFRDTIIALKSTNVACTIAAYEMLAGLVDYPFHVGITEAGTLSSGSIKSAVGIGSILSRGIGDTVRVSLTADPIDEIRVAKQILAALELKREGVEIISCPTCGRCLIDIIGLANRVEEKTRHIKTPLRVAIMGCTVNGPGEARAADVGIAGGKGEGVLFFRGVPRRKVKEKDLESTLLAEIEKLDSQ
jgi:(E)-4-hydroxy-3-methylbut-2-enyl-diphosphate synthase